MGIEWTTVEPDSEIKLVRVSRGTSRARFVMRNKGFGLVCALECGISTFDSESVELQVELINGINLGHSLARVSSKNLQCFWSFGFTPPLHAKLQSEFDTV